MTQESIILLLKKNIFYFFYLPFWILRGRAYFKHQVAKRINFDPALLPYHQELLTFLRNQYQQGRILILATASDIVIAKKIADYLGFFAEVVASDGIQSYSGKKKLTILQQKFPHGFDYAGNAAVDLHVWQGADNIIIVNNHKKLDGKVKALGKTVQAYASHSFTVGNWLRLLRVDEWTKNLLVFIPILVSWQWALILWVRAFDMFVAFSLCAGANYVLNDLLDLNYDRAHPPKHKRVLAQGKIQIAPAAVLLFTCLLASLLIAYFLTPRACLVLLVYFILSLIYSLYLKYNKWTRNICIGIFYLLRIAAGAVVI